MKRLFFILALLSACSIARAQTFTVNNNTSCSFSFSVVVSNPNTCDAAFTSQTITLAAGGIATYNSVNDLSWSGAAPPINAVWSGITVLDDGQMRFTGDVCAGFPSSVNLTSGCGSSETASYSVDDALDNIIIIWPSGG
jgi:hypothetical protein